MHAVKWLDGGFKASVAAMLTCQQPAEWSHQSPAAELASSPLGSPWLWCTGEGCSCKTTGQSKGHVHITDAGAHNFILMQVTQVVLDLQDEALKHHQSNPNSSWGTWIAVPNFMVSHPTVVKKFYLNLEHSVELLSPSSDSESNHRTQVYVPSKYVLVYSIQNSYCKR